MLRTNKLKYNIQSITGEEIVDITPSEQNFDLQLFQDVLLQNIKLQDASIV
jgi:hypothetical protein